MSPYVYVVLRSIGVACLITLTFGVYVPLWVVCGISAGALEAILGWRQELRKRGARQ